ncbi:MAG: TadE/TadG family type IV pilus assembly protein [Phycisphaerae bacterium]
MITRVGKKQRRGAAVVEMAIVSPLLFALLFGIIEFGWLFTVQNTLLNAAREGARTGCLQGMTQTDIQTRVTQLLTPMHLQSKTTVTITDATVANPNVTVALTVPRNQVSLVGNFFGFTSGNLNATCSMRKEGM